MNKSQRIYLNTGITGNVGVDKHIKVKLEQDVQTIEMLSMKISTSEVYQSFNADYGVLVGRVVANGGVGIQNVKISIFIPLDDVDAEDGDIVSIYPYTTPREKNNEGKRYNLLPRVTSYDPNVGLNKPKQPFGSFLIKSELNANEPFINVYKKYYKYTALTNAYGDYMIFGVPIGTQTVHMSVDITDIGKYSMSPASMIVAGYPANLFTDEGNAIKPSTDLNDLPHIETQEIAVDVIPFWGDTENFEIGITRQDFRIKAQLFSSFTIFGTSMTMGELGVFGDGSIDGGRDYAFYSINGQTIFGDSWSYRKNAIDIRTYRTTEPIIRVFTYNTDIPIKSDGTLNLPTGTALTNTAPEFFDENIRLLDKSEYFEYNVNGDFLLNIPCNRVKVITDDLGRQIQVPDDAAEGVFTKFYGMILINYPTATELKISSNGADFSGKHSSHNCRGWFKIPQSLGLREPQSLADIKLNNNEWRKAYHTFTGGGIYSVAQFYPTKLATGADDDHMDIPEKENTTNTFARNNDAAGQKYYFTGGAWFKVEGIDDVIQNDYDNSNYLITPKTGTTTSRSYSYDFSPNVNKFSTDHGLDASDKFFGGQWLNFCLFFPQYQWAYDSGKDRSQSWADVYHMDYYSGGEYFVTDNQQTLFANIKNTKYVLRGDAFSTAFIEVPKAELTKLFNIPHKGINVSRYNAGVERWSGLDIPTSSTNPKEKWQAKTTDNLSTSPYKYLNRKPSSVTYVHGQNYTGYYWSSSARYYTTGYGFDDYTGLYSVQNGKNLTAYLFKGMYENDCIKLLSDFNII